MEERPETVPWIETPLVRSAALSEAAGCNVLLKLENLQPSGSFKSRGIGNFIVAKLRALQADNNNNNNNNNKDVAHFYSSSAGNAGLACVHAAVTLGCRATVVVPLASSDFIVAKLRRAGAAAVIRHGLSWHEANGHLTGPVMAAARARGEAAVYVPPFDAPEIWDGNASMAREIARQAGRAVDAVVCSVGGGGLLCGLKQGLDELHMRRTRVVAVETQGADSLAQAVAQKQLVTLPAITSLAASLGARQVCRRALEYALHESVSTVVLPDAEAIRACRRFADDERFLVELACGVGLALCYSGRLAELVPGLDRDSVVVLVICGGSNVSLGMLEEYHELAGLAADHPGNIR